MNKSTSAIRFRVAVVGTFALAGGIAFGQGQMREQEVRPMVISRKGDVGAPSEGYLSAQTAMREGVEAEDRGDLQLAEARYTTAVELFPQHISYRLVLAKLHERRGNWKMALGEYRVALYETRGAVSSEQYDPCILTRYGELCLRDGLTSDAKRAFTRAASRFTFGTPATDPRPDPDRGSLPSLRSAAHLASAMEHRGVADDKAYAIDLDFAVEVDGTSWLARMYRARGYAMSERLAEARAEYRKASSLANAAQRRFLKQEYTCFLDGRDPTTGTGG